MKKFSLFFLSALLLFLVGCGGGDSSNDYNYDEDDSTQKNDSDADSNNKNDSDKQEKNDEDTDTGTSETENDDDSDVSDTGNDSEPEESGTFWETCEGIISCTTTCLEEDYDCINNCVTKGNGTGKLNYRRWRECFNEKCAEDQTAECSAEQCAEWDEKCNVAEALEYEFTIPAPYGNATFAGSFSYILNNKDPQNANQIVSKSFAEGQYANVTLSKKDMMMVSFVKLTKDKRDGDVVEVYQAPIENNSNSMSPLSPLVILRVKKDSAVEGEHSVGVDDESEARLIVADVDSDSKILCYHAFGIGTFKIEEADLQTGSSGRFKFSDGTAELFYPENIPALGGDATEILGVTACSLIY